MESKGLEEAEHFFNEKARFSGSVCEGTLVGDGKGVYQALLLGESSI